VVRRIKKKGNENEKRNERERIRGEERKRQRETTYAGYVNRWIGENSGNTRGKVKQCVKIK